MNWQAPTGMIRNDELLNALLAIWKLQRKVVTLNTDYLTGLEDGLDAIAQIAGLDEAFKVGKSEVKSLPLDNKNPLIIIQ